MLGGTILQLNISHYNIWNINDTKSFDTFSFRRVFDEITCLHDKYIMNSYGKFIQLNILTQQIA